MAAFIQSVFGVDSESQLNALDRVIDRLVQTSRFLNQQLANLTKR